jgi:hypothetical protein
VAVVKVHLTSGHIVEFRSEDERSVGYSVTDKNVLNIWRYKKGPSPDDMRRVGCFRSEGWLGYEALS